VRVSLDGSPECYNLYFMGKIHLKRAILSLAEVLLVRIPKSDFSGASGVVDSPSSIMIS
jgi:hypothetical protein